VDDKLTVDFGSEKLLVEEVLSALEGVIRVTLVLVRDTV